MFRKVVISLVTTRHSHHCSSTIACQYIIADPNRDWFFRKWMLYISASKRPRDCLNIGHTITFTSLRRCFNIRINLIALLWCGQLFNQFMFRCQGHKAHPKDGVSSCCKDLNIIRLFCDFSWNGFENNRRSNRFSDPVTLTFL